MERQSYYAYNRTREAFLSLGVSITHKAGGSSWAAASRRELRSNEGIWLRRSRPRRELGWGGPCDRIYLDSALCVVGLLESATSPSADPGPRSFDSVLLLPMHTIFSSQTQVGDQIFIATIDEIGAILGGAGPAEHGPWSQRIRAERRSMRSLIKRLTRVVSFRERRRSARKPVPPVMAFYWDGGIPVPHPVSDMSRTGLFLRTADRWLPQTLLRVTLQKASRDPVGPEETITIQCRVVRSGSEGVGLAFMLAEGSRDKGEDGTSRLASRKDLNRFFDRLASDWDASFEDEYSSLGLSGEEHSAEPESDAAGIPPKGVDQGVSRNSNTG